VEAVKGLEKIERAKKGIRGSKAVTERPKKAKEEGKEPQKAE
jgi:hypothetical protein